MSEHYDAVWRYARRLGMDVAHAEDIAQKTFIVAANKLDEIETGKEKSYLMRVATRQCSDARQSAFGRHTQAEDSLPVRAAPAMASPELQMSRQQVLEILDNALAELPSDLREVFVLVEVEEMTMAEVAEALSIHLEPWPQGFGVQGRWFTSSCAHGFPQKNARR